MPLNLECLPDHKCFISTVEVPVAQGAEYNAVSRLQAVIKLEKLFSLRIKHDDCILVSCYENKALMSHHNNTTRK